MVTVFPWLTTPAAWADRTAGAGSAASASPATVAPMTCRIASRRETRLLKIPFGPRIVMPPPSLISPADPPVRGTCARSAVPVREQPASWERGHPGRFALPGSASPPDVAPGFPRGLLLADPSLEIGWQPLDLDDDVAERLRPGVLQAVSQRSIVPA